MTQRIDVLPPSIYSGGRSRASDFPKDARQW